ncbi:hypothetical protein HYW83_04180 [Candidatus Peregrinibacteria bacterium]|nr:hypothetical protein [Candidatus Peregrinibacteria bacterium]
MNRDTLFGNILVACMATTLFAATGCSGSGNNSNPQSSWLQDDDLPDSTPVGKKAQPGLFDRLTGAAGGAAASGAAGKLIGGWMFWPTLICLVAGGVLLGFRIWGVGAVVAGIGLVLAVLQWGVGFGFKWYTALVAVWIILWAVSLMTPFKWDNIIVYAGSAIWLLLAAIGQVGAGLPGLTWGLLQALLVFSVAPALWRAPNPIGARWLVMIPLWILLLLTH